MDSALEWELEREGRKKYCERREEVMGERKGKEYGSAFEGQALDRLLISKTFVFYASLKNMT